MLASIVTCSEALQSNDFLSVSLRFLDPQPQLREPGHGEETDTGLSLWSMPAGNFSPCAFTLTDVNNKV